MVFVAEKTFAVEGICIPDTRLAREITQFVRDTEPALLFHHSSRVYYWGALAGKHRGLKFDRELLYAGAMFHDMGLTPAHSSAHERFEVDGANVARDFWSDLDRPRDAGHETPTDTLPRYRGSVANRAWHPPFAPTCLRCGVTLDGGLIPGRMR